MSNTYFKSSICSRTKSFLQIIGCCLGPICCVYIYINHTKWEICNRNNKALQCGVNKNFTSKLIPNYILHSVKA